MNSFVRVALEFKEKRIPILFQSNMDEVMLLQQSLTAFSLDKDLWEEFEIEILNLRCNFTNSNTLLQNDILVLKKKKDLQIYESSSFLFKEKSFEQCESDIQQNESSDSKDSQQKIRQIHLNQVIMDMILGLSMKPHIHQKNWKI